MTTAPTLATASATARLSNEPGRALLAIRAQHVVTDSPPPLGGPNEAANPAELFLAALASCCTFVCERAAMESGIRLIGISVTAAGDFDHRGVCGEPFDPRFQSFRLRVDMNGPDSQEKESLVDAFRHRCPVYTTLIRAASVEIVIG